MGVLTGLEIKERMKKGDIVIKPFNENQLGPNSYNLRLGNTLLVYTDDIIDMKKSNPTKEIIIPKEGYVLQPGELYLGKTIEWTETDNLVPILEGRSSTDRLGMQIHLTGGWGDIGNKLNWTLEIKVTKPLRVYAGSEVCQIAYHTIEGDPSMKYNGKYQGNTEIGASKMFKDFNDK